MKLTGEIIYNAAMVSNKFAERETWDRADQQRYNELAERLNEQLAAHQTQPLPEQQKYRTEAVIFEAQEVYPYDTVQDEANKWFKDHPGAVILHSHVTMFGNSEWTEYALTLVVELPVQEEQQPLTLQEAEAINAVEDEHE